MLHQNTLRDERKMIMAKKSKGPVESAKPTYEELLALAEAELAVDEATDNLKEKKETLKAAKLQITATINDAKAPLLDNGREPQRPGTA